MNKTKLNLRNVAMIFACLAVTAVFISCSKDNSGTLNKLGGSQSAIGQVGTTFNIPASIPGVGPISAEVTELNDGVSTIVLSTTVTNTEYRAMLNRAQEVKSISPEVVIEVNYRMTSDGIQEVRPGGNHTLNIVKYNAKVGDVYTLATRSSSDVSLRREVTKVSNDNDYAWNGMNIKTIQTVETGREIPGLGSITYVTNHKFGIVGVKFSLEDGTALSFPIIGSVTN